jgi:hypothetical protein
MMYKDTGTPRYINRISPGTPKPVATQIVKVEYNGAACGNQNSNIRATVKRAKACG